MRSTAIGQPMGVGMLLVQSVRTSLANYRVLLVLTLLLAVPSHLLTWIVQGAASNSAAATLVTSLLLNVVNAFLLSYFTAAATILISLRLGGRKASVWQLIRHMRGRIGLEMFGTSMLFSLVLLGWEVVALGVPMVVLLVGVGLGGAATAVAALVALVVAVPGLYVMLNRVVRYLFSSSVVILEHVAYRKALNRSSDLVAGRWWPTFATLVVVFVIGGVFASVLSAVTGTSWSRPDAIGTPASYAELVRNLLMAAVAGPYAVVLLVLMYFDLRARKEPNVGTLTEVPGVAAPVAVGAGAGAGDPMHATI